MIESEWDSCTDPALMLTFLRDSGKASERKLRLFAAGCCRRIWPLLASERSRRAVEVLESYADDAATTEELSTAARAAQVVAADQEASDNAYADAAAANAVAGDLPPEERAHGEEDDDAPAGPLTSAKNAAFAAGWAAGHAAHPESTGDEWFAATRSEESMQCHLLRCIFGNPLSPVHIDPAWRTPEVVALAQSAYDTRALPAGHLDPARLSILADALEEDAGCTDAELVGHLRQEGPHWRGCFAVDAVLGKS